MRVEGALLWEVNGEPRRDEILISDEGSHGNGSLPSVFDRQGRRRASSPGDLPADSVLVLPQTTTDEDLSRLRTAGYAARRSMSATTTDPQGVPSPSRDELIAEAEAEFEDAIGRMVARLREVRPDLFDEQGRLQSDAYEREIKRRFGSEGIVRSSDIVKLGPDTVKAMEGAALPDAP